MEIKNIKDYYEQVAEQFPQVDMADIKRILNFGFRSLYLHNSYGGDVLVQDSDMWCYFGTLRRDSLKHFDYYVKKLCLKIRVLYKRKKILWNGYYYFALTESQYQEYLKQKNHKGRPTRYFKFKDIFLYKILDECKVKEHSNKYIFKIKQTIDLGFRFYKKEAKLDRPELIIQREPLKFKDILVTTNKYDVI